MHVFSTFAQEACSVLIMLSLSCYQVLTHPHLITAEAVVQVLGNVGVKSKKVGHTSKAFEAATVRNMVPQILLIAVKKSL